MSVIIQLREDVAIELQNKYSQQVNSDNSNPETKKLLIALKKHGIKIVPVNPGQMHPLLVSQFMSETKDREEAEQIMKLLLKFKIVESAYFRPDDDLPSAPI